MNFFDKIYTVVKAIPYGQVATYGQVAATLGQPRAARTVGMALSRTVGSDVPWHRVINRHGMISIENLTASKDEQAMRLRQEGVEVTLVDNAYMIDLKAYLVANQTLHEAVS